MDAAETIIHAFVTSKLDRITNTQVARLQRLQNIAARTDHISPVLADLHTGYQLKKDSYTSCVSLFIKKKKKKKKVMHDSRGGQYIRRTRYIFWVNLNKFAIIVKLILSNLYSRKKRSVQSFYWAGDPEE